MPARPRSEWLKWLSAEEKARLFERALDEIEQEREKAQAYRDAADAATWELTRLRRAVSRQQKNIHTLTHGLVRFAVMPTMGGSTAFLSIRDEGVRHYSGGVTEVRSLVPIDPAWKPDLNATWTPIEDTDPFFSPAFYAPDPEPAGDAKDDSEWEDDE